MEVTNTSYAFSGLECPHTLVTTGTSESGSVKPVPAQLAHTGTLVSTHWHVLIHGSTTYLLLKNSITDETFQGGKAPAASPRQEEGCKLSLVP